MVSKGLVLFATSLLATRAAGFVGPALVLTSSSPWTSLSCPRTGSSWKIRHFAATVSPPPTDNAILSNVDEISRAHPLKVLIAGAGVGGLALAQQLTQNPHMDVTVIEQTSEFKRFGGPIQLASNALQILKEMNATLYEQVCERFTITGDKVNGIKDGIRTEWYAKFDLATPAKRRGMPYTGVIDRPDLQEIYLQALPPGTVRNGDGLARYEHLTTTTGGGGVKAILQSGAELHGDVLIGADGIWSAVRATMRNAPLKGPGSGATYSGYTVFAGELQYDSFDNGEVGYKVYIGPGQYFVITDIGNGNYQWYAFLARPSGSADSIEKPEGTSKYLQDIFVGWSDEIHHILKATQEHEIEQRDLYDRPPSVMKSWTDDRVALLGDGIHAMMPNLGQGGCQAIEDAWVIAEELGKCQRRSHVDRHLRAYQSRRLIRSAAVQGLSRFASDIIIRGFDTPAKVYRNANGKLQFENIGYAGIVTKMLQPILPIFFAIQFNFLYDGWRNRMPVDLKAAFGIGTVGGLILLLLIGSVGGEIATGFAVFGDALFGTEGLIDLDAISTGIQNIFAGGGTL